MKNRVPYLLLLLIISFSTSGQHSKSPSIAKADSLLFAGDFKSAKEMYAKVLKDTSRNAGAWSRYGLANLNLKNYDEALKYFDKALMNHAAGPVKMNTYASLARAYSMKNNKPKALVNLDSAAVLGYANLNLVDTHADYANIRNEAQFKVIRQKIYATANPCMVDPKAREFDFWIGEWDVYVTGTKTFAGNSKIEMISQGCAILENWTSNASTGKSLNFLDPITGKWKQTWVGSYLNGTQEFVDGEYRDGAMRFTFDFTIPPAGKTIGRFIFFNEKPGQVRQFNETSADGGKTWVTSYDFTYFLKK